MRTRAAHALLFAVELALLVPAAMHAALLVGIFASRIDYPMDIEWMEGGALLHVHRLLRGLPIYTPPSEGFMPYPYPPLHYAAVAAVGAVAGLDYWTGRAVFIAAFCLACAVLAVEVNRAGRGRPREGMLFAAMAVGAAAASYPAVGGWYDVVRNDSLAIALPLLGAALVSDDKPTRPRLLAAAATFALALFAKQTAAFFIAWVSVFLFVRSPRRGVLFAAVTFALALAALVAIQRATGGYFRAYTVTNLSRHPVSLERAWNGVKQLVEFAPFLLLLVPMAIVARLRRSLRPRSVLWLGMLVAAFPAALLPFAKAGGFNNNLIPVAILAGTTWCLLAIDVVRGIRGAPSRTGARAIALGLAAAFLYARVYTEKPFVPSAELRRDATALNTFVASLQGGLLIPNHPFLAVRNGHETPQFHDLPYWDARVGGMPGLDLPGFIQRTRAEWLIMSGVEGNEVRGVIHQSYKRSRLMPVHVSTFTGFRSSPRDLMALRKPTRRRNARALFDFASDLDGWVLQGTAFAASSRRRTGEHWILTSEHDRRRDKAVGTATSPEFVVDRAFLGFAIGGGKGRGTRVELHVDGAPQVRAYGLETNALTPIVWNLRAFEGKPARLVVVDEEEKRWGHVAIADVQLFD